MNLRNLFKLPWTKKQFVTDRDYEHNLNKQVNGVPLVVEQLRKIGISNDKELSVEYFFYTNSIEKAKQLAVEMELLQYSAVYREAAGGDNLFVITGQTTKMRMADEVITKWVERMCELSHKYDCEFDGWGTLLE